MCIPAGEDVGAVRAAGDGIDTGGAVVVVFPEGFVIAVGAPLGERAGVAVMADERPAGAVRGEVLFAAVQGVPVEEDDVAGAGRDQDLIVFVGHARQVVHVVIDIGDAFDVLDVGDQF